MPEINFTKYASNTVSYHTYETLQFKISMMWPSQNFFLCNGTIIKIKVNEWVNNF